MRDKIFSASMMCANYASLEKEVRSLEAAGIDAFHIDIMDGQYVRNFGMGLHDFRYIRSATNKSVECHLMIENPINYINLFADIGADVIYIHPDSEYHTSSTLQAIIDAGITPGIVLDPGKMTEGVLELLYVVKRVLVMGVNPGNAGQTYMPFVDKKICKLLTMRDEYGFEVFWDGAGSVENITRFAPLGVRGFVLGTATLFDKERGYKEILDGLRAM